MQINPINKQNFTHIITMDIGASSPRATVKLLAQKDNGKDIFEKSFYLNDTADGFLNSSDFTDKIAQKIADTETELQENSQNYGLIGDDKKLSGVAFFMPGGCKDNQVQILGNLFEKSGKNLKHINLNDIRSNPVLNSLDNFKIASSQDSSASGIIIASKMLEKGLIGEGSFITVVMAGGGLSSIDVKIKNGIAEFEMGEVSSNAAANVVDEPNLLDFSPIIKFGELGHSTKTALNIFFKSLNLSQIYPLYQKIGDTRIITENKFRVNSSDVKLSDEIKSCGKFVEIEKNADFSIFSLDITKDEFNAASKYTVEKIANAYSLLAINKINEYADKLVLTGNFLHALNKFVEKNPNDFYDCKNLPDLIMLKIKQNIVDIPLVRTQEILNSRGFEIICNDELNLQNNTKGGLTLLNDGLKFMPNSGNWFTIATEQIK